MATRAIANDPAAQPAELRGADLVCVALERCGVDVVFGYPGGACLPIYDALPDHPSVRHVLVRHEQGAAHMADGYARTTGRPGVCLVTSGPGATNLVTGLASAFMDSVPIVAITGQVATSLMGRDAFQETDVLGMVGPVTKHAFLPRTAAEIVPTIERAMHVARSGRPGPVVVDIPKDAQNATAALPGPIVPLDTRAELPEREIEEAAALLDRAERPLVIAGHGVRLARAHEALRDLVERIDAPVAMTLLGIGAFSEDHELALGMLGMHGSAITNRAVNAADVILAVGLRFDDRVTGKIAAFAPHARIIHVDIDPTQIAKNVMPAVGIVADAREALRAITVRVERRSRPAWRTQVFARSQARPRLEAFEARVELAPRPVIHAIRAAAAEDAYFVADVGQHQMWAAQHLRFTHPDRFFTSGGLGAMGYALPAALGVQYARRDAEVWAIAGDGGVQMTLQELGTAVQEDLPVKLVVMNNGYLGMVRQWQQLFYDGRISQTPIASPDYMKIAEAYGAFGAVVEHRDDLAPTLARAARHPGPALVDVRIERHANVWPIVPPGGANADLIEEPTA
jgi:acetolactate synthase I/II/III large subunit